MKNLRSCESSSEIIGSHFFVNLLHFMEIFPWTSLEYEKCIYENMRSVFFFLNFGVSVPLWKRRVKRSVWIMKLHGSRKLLRGWCQGKPRSLYPKGNQTLWFIDPDPRLNDQQSLALLVDPGSSHLTLWTSNYLCFTSLHSKRLWKERQNCSILGCRLLDEHHQKPLPWVDKVTKLLVSFSDSI